MKHEIEDSESGLVVVLDSEQIFPDNPGMGTPAMVEKRDDRGRVLDSGTFNCALGESELSDKGTRLTTDEYHWLEDQMDEVEEWLEANKPQPITKGTN